MYVRFVSPQPLEERRGNMGIFQPALDIVYDDATPHHVYWPIRQELDWFNEHLPKPRATSFEVRSRKSWRSDGICWFHDDAHEMIYRAFVLSALLRDCGVNITKLATNRPGQILYRDDYQIIAKPAAETPVEWS
ncbi:MAG: hypothetical protein Pars92KO_19000 [Parasphingorhabdus sp.]